MDRARWIGLVAAAAAAALAVYAVYGDSSAPQDQKDSLKIVVPGVLVIAALVYGLLVPWARKRSPATAGLVVSVVSFLAVAAFWSGLPIVLGAAGATLGIDAREGAASRSGKATAAVVVGVVAAVLSIAVAVAGNAFH
jgi:hypothetical protein